MDVAKFLAFGFLLVLTAVCGDPPVAWCQSRSLPPGSASDETPAGADVPLLVGITVLGRPVSTDSANAQRYFDQALNFSYAFNHDEAIRSFRQAAKYDPSCAMAWWGIALSHGPHINNPIMDKPRSIAAWESLQKALEHRRDASPVERALIDALAARYLASTQDNIAQRAALDQRYANEMASVHKRFADDSDVAVLYAESLMNLRPWDLWSNDGKPRPETPKVLGLLEKVMANQPSHPGANHLYIHAVEASPNPGRAIAAADRLRTLMPGSGHMVHMPAHIDVRTGNWSKAADQNERAIKVDTVYQESSPHQQFYKVYMLHNPHFLSFVCMMEGREVRALQAARQMLASVPPEFLDESAAVADHLMSIEYQVLVRFGKWDNLLEMPAPRSDLPITTAMWRFARATALAAQGKIVAAECEQARFRAAAAAVPEDAMGAINRAEDILQVGEHTLAGEIAFRKGQIEKAVVELTKGVAAEDRLLYMEPPEWIQPVRHSLGAVLVLAKRWDEAEAVYRADLAKWPENGWSLYGLAQCLRAKGDAAGAADVEKRFRTAWARADTQIDATCLCVQ